MSQIVDFLCIIFILSISGLNLQLCLLKYILFQWIAYSEKLMFLQTDMSTMTISLGWSVLLCLIIIDFIHLFFIALCFLNFCSVAFRVTFLFIYIFLVQGYLFILNLFIFIFCNIPFLFILTVTYLSIKILTLLSVQFVYFLLQSIIIFIWKKF